MSALSDSAELTYRRRRYRRTPSGMPPLTPVKLRALRLLAECRVLSLPQMARLLEGEEMRPKSAREKSARRHLRELYDAGLAELAPVSRASLAGEDSPNDDTLLHGSAPNVYVPTAEGVKLLVEYGLIEKAFIKRSTPSYGPKNSMFLAHELQVREARVWLERLLYAHPGSALLAWEDGPDANLPLLSGFQVRPDAWFTLQFENGQRLTGLVEADRGTERGRARWREKVEYYTELFLAGEGAALKETTGSRNARVLVTVPSEARRESLAVAILDECNQVGFPHLAERFWLARIEDLEGVDLYGRIWRLSTQEGLRGMLERAIGR